KMLHSDQVKKKRPERGLKTTPELDPTPEKALCNSYKLSNRRGKCL
ncbi:MAG: hypothetical protein ACI8PG_000508, partial [Planctomycetota bacterium]